MGLIYEVNPKIGGSLLNPKPGLAGQIIETLRIHYKLGWIAGYTEAGVAEVVSQAEGKLQQIKSAGLNIATCGDGKLCHGILPANFEVLHPTIFRQALATLRSRDCNWGHVDIAYYGTADNPKPVPHGFEGQNVAGKPFFVLHDSKAPGHNPIIPGSVLSDMAWGPRRDEAAQELLTKYQQLDSTLNFAFLNYATHGLIWLSQIYDLSDALGRVGLYDNIGQPYNTPGPCPCSGGGGPFWSARYADASPNCAAAVLVW